MLFISNFKNTIKASVTYKYDAKIQYLCTLLRGEALCQFDTLSSEVRSASPENLTSIVLVLGKYFFPDNALSKKKRTMHRGMRNLHSIRVI